MGMVNNVHVQILIWIGFLLQETLVKMRVTEGKEKKGSLLEFYWWLMLLLTEKGSLKSDFFF